MCSLDISVSGGIFSERNIWRFQSDLMAENILVNWMLLRLNSFTNVTCGLATAGTSCERKINSSDEIHYRQYHYRLFILIKLNELLKFVNCSRRCLNAEMQTIQKNRRKLSKIEEKEAKTIWKFDLRTIHLKNVTKGNTKNSIEF